MVKTIVRVHHFWFPCNDLILSVVVRILAKAFIPYLVEKIFKYKKLNNICFWKTLKIFFCLQKVLKMES